MDSEKVKAFYRQPEVVRHYAQAANAIGLWHSEELLFKRFFPKETALLELGCGAGRIALGLWELGYSNIVATDYAHEMVQEALQIASLVECPFRFLRADATALGFDNEVFEGAIFGFNGLMQIPLRSNRLRAMCEIARVLRPGSYFIFTTHDRANPKNRLYWKDEQRRWNEGSQQEELDEFGDLYRPTEFGPMYIHSPELEEIREDLREAGFVVEIESPRSSLANEPLRVREFSDECRFWVAHKPA